jgi:dihydroorotate dehydrogenase electron transfer subunit
MAKPAAKPHRGSIALEQAEVIRQERFEAGQYVLRLNAPQCAARALPGQFAHLQCHPLQPMRRPLSILRCSPEAGWVEFLYKVVGTGTQLLAQREAKDKISLLGPIGEPFKPDPSYTRPLLIGGGVGMPPMIFLAERLRATGGETKPFVILGSEVPFPFSPRPSQILVPELPAEAIGAMPLLDDWGIPSRLASQQGYPGCFQGFVTELADRWLQANSAPDLDKVMVFACGPHPMLHAVADLAARHRLPCQVSLEEFMACAVGGCAGCAVRVETERGPAMRRVCVDGPVFDAASVFPRSGC